MRTSVAALALAAALATPAIAQQGNTANPGSQGTTGGGNAMTMAPATQPSGTTAAPGTTTGPAASQSRAGTATQGAPMGSTAGTTTTRTDGSAAGSTAAGTTGNRAADNNNAAVQNNPGDAPRVTATPAAGANSFTEGQARSRIEAAGFTGVQDLKKDEAGVWRGRAMRGGQTAEVGLDFQGNVVTGAAPAR
jgi:hypothetical protein